MFNVVTPRPGFRGFRLCSPTLSRFVADWHQDRNRFRDGSLQLCLRAGENPRSCKNSIVLYETIGGMETCRKLSIAFYARVERDPLLRPLFPGKTFNCAIEAFTLFLAQFLGGPSEYSETRWFLSLREAHLRFAIGVKERNAWMKNMRSAIEDVELPEAARRALIWFFTQSSAWFINRGNKPRDADGCAPASDHLHQEIAEHWRVHQLVEDVVAALRGGDARRAIALAESDALQTYFLHDRPALLSLLALMSGSGDAAMLDYVRQTLARNHDLVGERHARGRTLLHAAAGAGSLPIIEVLLASGADPSATDQGGHTPLYCVANECGAPSGGDVVRALVQAGANVNANDGVKRCTPLHMAARRGYARVAEALLECGANIEARDSLGDTPLRRAVNCGRADVVRLLLSRGADIHSIGSRGLTPLLAARTRPIKLLLSRGTACRTGL
jgi:truncated hemoglobin YjbI